MIEFLNRHEKIALMFSGGKDSVACLELFKDHLHKITVVWTNARANFPEVESYIVKVSNKVPHFLEILSNQPRSIELNGYPADVVPSNYTAIGQAFTGKKEIKIRTYYECCNENIWSPTAHKLKELGFTGVIRGQRNDESHRAPMTSGTVVDGIEYFFPLENWPNHTVTSYLEHQGVELDERLRLDEHSSLDCWNCTAFSNNSTQRMEYIRKYHFDKHESVVKTMQKIDNAITAESLGIKQYLRNQS